jgi:cytoplasmic iron level regulating protein YaaA (DUF328/UPF0246 family)
MAITDHGKDNLQVPELITKAKRLGNYLKTLSTVELEKIMKISPALAKKTHQLIDQWNTDAKKQSPAIDSFIGDIYSGLQAQTLSDADRKYANDTLKIFSGLYGVLRPNDGIYPYRLEMAYKLSEPEFSNLYSFWGKSIADCLPNSGPIINLSSDEYSNTITKYIDPKRIISPKFLTESPKTKEPTFVVVHAKIARGAFARWLIVNRIKDISELITFQDLSYHFDPKLSTPNEPVFVCQEFGGKGLSIKKHT